MSNAVFNSVRNQAAGALSGSFKKVIGGIFNSKGTSNTSAFAPLRKLTSSDYLSYPANVDNDPMQGHWVLFEILKLKPTKATQTTSSMPKAYNEFGDIDPKATAELIAKQRNRDQPKEKDHTMKGVFNASGGRSFWKAKAEASKKLEKTIALYMPPSVSVSYNANYADKEISQLADFGVDAIKAFIASGNSGKGYATRVADAIGGASGHLEAGIRTGLIRAADGIVPGIESIMAIESGQIIGNHMELMFQGVGRRSFSFTFIFIPKSKKEAETVEEICKLFKIHMMPEWADGTTKRAMTIPDMFDITYMHKKQGSKHLNKISTCFCESAQVTYGSDRYTAYTDGRPQRTTLALNFKEIEIMTRKRIEIGF